MEEDKKMCEKNIEKYNRELENLTEQVQTLKKECEFGGVFGESISESITPRDGLRYSSYVTDMIDHLITEFEYRWNCSMISYPTGWTWFLHPKQRMPQYNRVSDEFYQEV